MPLVILTEVTSNIVSHPDVDYTKLFPVSHFKGKTPLSGPSDGKIDDGPDDIESELLFESNIDDMRKYVTTMFMTPIVHEQEFDIEIVDSPIKLKLVPVNPIQSACFVKRMLRRD